MGLFAGGFMTPSGTHHILLTLSSSVMLVCESNVAVLLMVVMAPHADNTGSVKYDKKCMK